MSTSQDSYRIIPVRDSSLLRSHGIYYTPRTLRKMHCEKKHPEIFLKIGSRLHIDLDAWARIVKSAQEKTAREVEKLKKKGLIPEAE